MVKKRYRQPCLSMRPEMADDIDSLRGAIPRSTLVHNLLTLALRDDEMILKALDGDV